MEQQPKTPDPDSSFESVKVMISPECAELLLKHFPGVELTPANIEILVVTVFRLAEPVTAYQLVGYDAGPAGADEPVLGIAKTAGAVGEAIAVAAIGIVELRAATALAAGDPVYADANGAASNVGANNPFGTVLRGGGPGDIVAIILK